LRWLLAKDLLILRRSRLTVALLIVYPVAIALLLGLAISRGPAAPRVAIVDETPPGQTVQVGAHRIPVSRYAQELFSQVQALSTASRAQAIARVRAGDAVAAVIIPADIATRIASLRPASVEVIYDGNALEQALVQSSIESAIARANTGFSEQIQRPTAATLRAILQGGETGLLGGPPDAIGLARIPAALSALVARAPAGAASGQLRRIEASTAFAARELSQSSRLLATVGEPIGVHSSVVAGRRTPLDAFAVVVAVSVSLMFVCVLLAAGGVALEREENALARLARGLVSAWALLAEKALLGAVCAFVLAFAMIAGVGAFVTLDWSRAGQWVLALALGAGAFGALGVAVGALAHEVRAATLLAILLSMPLALLALVPRGAVAGGFYDAIGVISFVFPFRASLQALDAAVNGSAPPIAGSLAHLVLLIAVFASLARAGLMRAG
jgi:ABC-2 type transport system permease protein